MPAYNIVQKRPDGQPFHPKGSGNGYVINFDKTRVYVAGDTENIPEMAQLKKIDIAFLPMNLPYTMTPEMVAEAAKMFEPQNPLPVSLRPDGPEHAGRPVEGFEDRGPHSEDEVTAFADRIREHGIPWTREHRPTTGAVHPQGHSDRDGSGGLSSPLACFIVVAVLPAPEGPLFKDPLRSFITGLGVLAVAYPLAVVGRAIQRRSAVFALFRGRVHRRGDQPGGVRLRRAPAWPASASASTT